MTDAGSAIGVHSLDHFALSVPDLQEARRFYEAFGLDTHPEGDVLGLYTTGSPHRWARLIEGREKRLDYLSFGIFEQDLQRFERQVDLAGVRIASPPHHAGKGLWIQGPDGMQLELRPAPKTSPNRKCAAELISSPPGKAGAPARSQSPATRPSRLSHCLIFTRDVSAAIGFYRAVLGLRLSDRSADDIAFMHGIHGSDHHLIALARSNAPGLHHASWDVRSVNDIGAGAMQMAAQGYTRGWGLGRHVLGSNYFHYVRDPWGSYSEYSCDMDYIPAGHAWQAGDHAAEDAFYVWGPNPPADFTHNYEAERP